ncbi:2,3,4,5-tetrahydropyridine-2,6-dicarboxylate N-acetyltransferase [Enterococcus phoeniculicola]|jgi:tetrahydrodipicolinate N-acetyltransferase|uniref:2,3,4,5-tetrahydropyridine-2,6-dicarboxylate N-acetyltransferase n=1 Tax=Enterococcus phoeniculicola ATCC BAA-412 TaxID=1158610 RepID=R3TWZ5_9ENTE|nr:2,3,4,5-tetrahydropyridine-2,6-dicarboxylate N-acetyltransferase [Enterococcus phoeniculicola]EOL46124.1 2,3,4,5-tetrahydropyridine-2,6-dicarboxylate N-acetyltransferase [Enterococcus phoeniculicola ATCC BAA-412]EOT77031.1 2,3,4,5-tetrahydropyridine-2,6-dicarboxylate N-acetyltransferase [Enterococcus phoeniculicola ATCC BAA-412]OJG73370.1 2,3,4,5-tetrahydropyridine-2,6-dicarboxylate N-acetyltransferase [Enterococcus phoeniculicola]
MDAHEIIRHIGNAKKRTPVKVTIKGNLKELIYPDDIRSFTNCKTGTLFGEWEVIKPFLEENSSLISDYVVENDMRNSAIALLDKKELNARIEPGAIIREQVEIGDHAVIMMGAIINIGAVVGEGTMIDMGAVLGGRAITGKNCHIGAGTVLAGVIEPPSANPVVVEDDVLIGANAVVLEGIRIGKGAVVAAGAVVVHDVAPYTVVAGVPARKIKDIDEQTKGKTSMMEELRNL